ncbi:MAG: hypothetical protein ACJ77M_16710 [Thermoleophilaceae bacterium]
MASEGGQATVEWTGVVLLVCVSLGGLLAFGPRVDGRSLGGLIAHSIVCQVRSCSGDDDELVARYGARDAALVRRFAPSIVYEPGTYTLPVDFRQCRSHRCSDAPDDQSLDVHRSARGSVPATAFTHVVHEGGRTYVQYWLYYPDSNSVFPGSRQLWDVARFATFGLAGRYPGFHNDDWEGYQVEVGPDGRAVARATAHDWYQTCKFARCRNKWMPVTGWTRVSKGSHAGHIPTEPVRTNLARRHGSKPMRVADRPSYPGVDFDERTTTAAGLRLVPIESVDTAGLKFDGITPPWRKEVYTHPRSDSTS